MKTRTIDGKAFDSIGENSSRGTNPPDAKTKFTISIADDVLLHFRQRAKKLHGKSIEAQINQELRVAMERNLAEEAVKLDKVAGKLANDPRFIKTVSEKLKIVIFRQID